MEYDYDQDIYAKPIEEGVDYHDYYAGGDSNDDMEDVFNGDGFAPFTLTQIYENCLVPNLLDAIRHVGKLVFWCIMFRVLTQAGNRATGEVYFTHYV